MPVHAPRVRQIVCSISKSFLVLGAWEHFRDAGRPFNFSDSQSELLKFAFSVCKQSESPPKNQLKLPPRIAEHFRTSVFFSSCAPNQLLACVQWVALEFLAASYCDLRQVLPREKSKRSEKCEALASGIRLARKSAYHPTANNPTAILS